MRRMTVLALAGLGAGVGSVLSGCDTVKAPPAGRADTIKMEQYPGIVAQDGLNQWLGFNEPVFETGTPDRPARVTVPTRSLADVGMNVQYRFLWFDDKGRPVRTQQEGWRFINIQPRAQVMLDSNALETAAKSWRLELRSAR
ncbi:MAG: DUF1425 domain-containing protein [Phycisphaerales bacterium]|nr:DUF1425 domain-containing protein [Phycisphaerales bacterium]